MIVKKQAMKNEDENYDDDYVQDLFKDIDDFNSS